MASTAQHISEDSITEAMTFKKTRNRGARVLSRSSGANASASRLEPRVTAIITANVTLSGTCPPSDSDGVTVEDGQLVLAPFQTDATQRLVWIYKTGGPWMLDTNQIYTPGMTARVLEGSYTGSTWKLLTDEAITAGATSLTWGLDVGTVPDNEITDLKIGPRTADDSSVYASLTGTLTQLLSLIATKLKAITGKSSALTAPATTLEAANTHYGVVASTSVLGHAKLGTQVTMNGSNQLQTPDNQSVQKLMVSKAGSTIGTRKRINLIEGLGITLTVADNPGSDSIDVTAATSGAGGTVTSVDVSGGTTGLTTSGGPITGSGTITLAGTLAVTNGGTGATTAAAARTNIGAAAVSGTTNHIAYFSATNTLSTTRLDVSASIAYAYMLGLTGDTKPLMYLDSSPSTSPQEALVAVAGNTQAAEFQNTSAANPALYAKNNSSGAAIRSDGLLDTNTIKVRGGALAVGNILVGTDTAGAYTGTVRVPYTATIANVSPAYNITNSGAGGCFTGTTSGAGPAFNGNASSTGNAVAGTTSLAGTTGGAAIYGQQGAGAGGPAVYADGSLKLRRLNVTAAVTLTEGNLYVAITAAPANYNITLPAAAAFTNRVLIIHDEGGVLGGGAARAVTLIGTIDGAVNKVLNIARVTARLISDGTNWHSW